MPSRTTKPTIPHVAPETWAELHRLADELRALELWDCMGDAELLGVDDPRTGEPMLGAVMGGAGQVFGLAIYHGEGGRRSVLQAALGDIDEPPIEDFHRVGVLKVEFVPKAELQPMEKRRVKELGFQPARKRPQWWPTFQSMRPGYVPWHLDQDDADLLLHLLPRFIALGACVKPLFDDSDPLMRDGFAFWPKGRAPGGPLRLDEVDWRRLALPPDPEPVPFSVDEFTAARLARLPQEAGLALEVDAFAGFGSIGGGPRPWFTKVGLAADAHSGFIAALVMGESPQEPIEAIAGRALVHAATSLAVRPASVSVRHTSILQAIEPFARQLGIRIGLRRDLPMIEEAREAMPDQFGVARPADY